MRGSVLVLTPAVDTGVIDVERTLDPFRSERVSVTHTFIDDGPASIETEADIAACLPGVRRAAQSPAAQAARAVVVNCMCDPGVDELRAMLDVPVLGPAQTSMHVAAALGSRFAVIDVLAEGRDYVDQQVRKFGLQSSYASHRALGIPVLELYRDVERTLIAIEREARLALEVDGADTLLLGCTGLAQLAHRFNERFARGHRHYRLLEPLSVTLGVACTLVGAVDDPEDA